MTFTNFDNWADVLTHVRNRRVVYYQAPLDHQPVRVTAQVNVTNDAVRVYGDGNFDSFWADAEHLSRFRKRERGAKTGSVPASRLGNDWRASTHLGDVYVYRNLKHGRQAPPLYSVLRKGRVLLRASSVLLSDATFVVRESGRQRVLREGRKNVHAFVKGRLVSAEPGMNATLAVKVRYNPFDGPNFVGDGRALAGAGTVLLNEHGLSAENVRAK